MDVISIVNGLESFFFDLCLLGLELVARKSCSGSFYFWIIVWVLWKFFWYWVSYTNFNLALIWTCPAQFTHQKRPFWLLILQPEEGTSHICVFTPKELVKWQLGLLVITYIAQFDLMDTNVGLSAPLHNTNLLNPIHIIQGITDSQLTPLVFSQEFLSWFQLITFELFLVTKLQAIFYLS